MYFTKEKKMWVHARQHKEEIIKKIKQQNTQYFFLYKNPLSHEDQIYYA
jgi:hypothetical protein